MYLLMLLLIAVMYLMNIIELFSLTRSYTLINKKLYPVIQKCYTYFLDNKYSTFDIYIFFAQRF